jgi:hypothetical protein
MADHTNRATAGCASGLYRVGPGWRDTRYRPFLAGGIGRSARRVWCGLMFGGQDECC